MLNIASGLDIAIQDYFKKVIYDVMADIGL